MNSDMEPLSSSSFTSNPINSVSMSSLGSGTSTATGCAPLPPPKLLIPGKHLPDPTNSLISLQVHAATVPPTPMDVVPVLTTPVETPKGASLSAREKPFVAAEKQEEKVGRWSDGEHKVFLEGLELHGKQWKIIAQMIGTRTVVQVRTHAQKYFQKMERANKGSSGAGGKSSTSTAMSAGATLTPVPRTTKTVSKRKSLTGGISTSTVVTRKKSRSPKKTTRVVSIASSSLAAPPPPLLPGAASSPPPPLELPHYISNVSSLENLSTISPTGVTDMDLGLVSSYSSSVNMANVAAPDVYKPEPMVTTSTVGATAPGVAAPPVGLDVNVEELGDDPLEWLIDGGINHLPESSLEHAPMFPDFSDMEATATTDAAAPAVQVQPKTSSLLDTSSTFLQEYIADPKVTVQSLFLDS